MKDTLRYIAECVYSQEQSDEDLRLSASKVILGMKWGGLIPEGDIDKVANAYTNLIRAGQIVGV